MARHSSYSLPDLLAWPEIEAARQEVRKWNDAKIKAIRKAFIARYGTKKESQRNLLEANTMLLRAELKLEELMKKANF